MKKFILDILTNPDGLSFSSKRVAGYITLLSLIGYIFTCSNPNIDAMFTLAGLVSIFFGLSTIDYKSRLSNPKAAKEIATTAANVSKN